jgi:hypothetical protein
MSKGSGQTRKSASARLALGWAFIGLMLVSGASVAMLGHLTVAHGATTSSTSTTESYLVTTDSPSYSGSATISVSGIAPTWANSVGVLILQPSGTAIADNVVATAQNSTFRTAFHAGGPGWNITGRYYVVVTAAQADTVQAPTTYNATFGYTAVATSTSQTSSATQSTSSLPLNGTSTSSTESVLAIVAVIVVAVALVGFMLRSRGRRKPGASSGPTTSKA